MTEHTSVGERKQMVEPDHSGLSVLQQCILLGLARSSFYYKPVGESEFNLMIMRIMDEIHLDYPYLLRGLDIVRPNQVWEMDITYIPMRHGFMYLAAIIDVFSRRIMGWGLSNTMEDGVELWHGIDNYIRIYNTKRLHQSLDYQTSDEVYKKVS